MKKKPTQKRDRFKGQSNETRAINDAFDTAAFAIRGFMLTCAKNGSPMRCLTYRVLDNGETRCHVTYRRVSKQISRRASGVPKVAAKRERQRRGGKKATILGVTAGETATCDECDLVEP